MTVNIQITDEAIKDMVEQISYIRRNLCNPTAADRLFDGLKMEIAKLSQFPYQGTDCKITYRNYKIHKKVYQSYLLFYIFHDTSKTIIILRVLKNIMNWPGILREHKIYHFSNYKTKKE